MAIARPASVQAPIEDLMFRALAVLRIVLLGNSIGLYVVRHGDYVRPMLGMALIVALAAWTVFALWRYSATATRTDWLFLVDLVIALGMILLTEPVKGEVQATLPGFWVAGVVLAWAIHWRTRGGLLAAVLVAIADVAIRNDFTQANYGNVFLLLIGAPVVGFMSGLLQDMALERDAALRMSAASAERQRLGRVVHDGVLQVLAIVQRRGAEIGGEALELSRLAGEQEVALRAYVQHDRFEARPVGDVDVEAALAALATSSVSVASPGRQILMDAERAEDLVAVVSACLSNVRHHVGPEAPAWVLVEDLGTRVAVSVRDAGPGIAPGRLDEARTQGRLGVAQSIEGRVADLGGTAVLHTSSAGTEWEFEVPR